MSEHSLLLETPPRDWTAESFGDMCIRVQDSTSPTPNGQRLYLGLEHLASGFPALVGRGSESEVRSGKTAFRKGDVLFGKLRPYLRKSALVSEDGICSTDILVFRASDKSLAEFLCLLTHSDEFVGHAKATTSGVQHPRTSWASLQAFKLHVPPLAEQRKIAEVLRLVQRAMEQQEQLIALTTELKKALLHQFFTQGLRGEPQKQTEIGPVPESWDVVELGDVISESPKNGLYKHNTAYGSGTLILRINDFSNDGDEVFTASHRVAIDAGETQLYALREGDIVTNRVNSLSHLGKTALIGKLEEPMVFESNMMRFRVAKSLAIPSYVLRLLNSPVCKKQFLGTAKRAVGQASINQGNLRAVKLPLPSVSVQRELVTILDTVIRKIDIHQRKCAALTAMFRTMLHELVTAELRVHDLDLPRLLEDV